MIELENLSLEELNDLAQMVELRKRELLRSTELKSSEELIKQFLSQYKSKSTQISYKSAIYYFIAIHI